MAHLLENIKKLNLPKSEPPTVSAPVLEVAARLGLTLTLTSPSVPEQYEISKNNEPSGYVRVRHGGMSVYYPDAGAEELYHGAVDGFGGFTHHEREAKLLFALGLISARMMMK